MSRPLPRGRYALFGLLLGLALVAGLLLLESYETVVVPLSH